MKLIKTNFKGLNIYKKKYFKDSRGYFLELYKKKIINKNFPFTCISFSKKNVIRGLHLQTKNAQGKYISVLKGKVLDVVLDLRKNSKTFGKIFKIILSDKNCLSLYVPKGFAHAYYSYEKLNIVYYKLTNYYKPQYESGINLLDKKIKIKWPKRNFKISKKDNELPSFEEFCKNYKFL